MIGSGLKKLAKENALKVSNGVAYGSLMGYAATMDEGSGYKRLVITTRFAEPGKKEELRAVLGGYDLTRQYRVRDLSVSSRAITVVFNDTVGTMKKIQAFIQWFMPLLGQYGATGAEICTECGSPVGADGTWKLIGGDAYYLHEACAQKIQREIEADTEQRQQEDTGSYMTGTLGALLGAVLGAVVWALVLTGGYIASFVGFIIGWLAEKGYNLLRGKQGKGKIAILIIAVIFGVLLGTFAGDALELVGMISSGEILDATYGDIPLMILYLLIVDSEYLAGTAGNVLLGLLFAGLGVFSLLKKASNEVTGTKIITLK